MDASPVFMNLIKNIEESQLNYSMSRTPFSATISLRCSFLKRFAEGSQMSSVRKMASRTDLQLEEHVKQIEAEKIELQAEVENLRITFEHDQKKAMEELIYLKEVYEKEKERSNDFESKISEFREEVLKLKSEKKKLNINLKIEKEDCDALRLRNVGLEEENKASEKVIQDRNAAFERKQAEVLKVSDEKEALKKAIIEIDAELKDLKHKELRQSKCLFECETCDFRVENYNLLKRHKLENHSHHTGCQYENCGNFEHYNCFYCDVRIISVDNLEDHYMTCQNEFAVMIEPPVTNQEVDKY